MLPEIKKIFDVFFPTTHAEATGARFTIQAYLTSRVMNAMSPAVPRLSFVPQNSICRGDTDRFPLKKPPAETVGR
jgi:hypothetical protein